MSKPGLAKHIWKNIFLVFVPEKKIFFLSSFMILDAVLKPCLKQTLFLKVQCVLWELMQNIYVYKIVIAHTHVLIFGFGFCLVHYGLFIYYTISNHTKTLLLLKLIKNSYKPSILVQIWYQKSATNHSAIDRKFYYFLST